MKFDDLIRNIIGIHERLKHRAVKSVDMALTARNWFIGFYIDTYERRGQDRAKYGQKLMDQISKELISKGMERCDRRELYRYHHFFLAYPNFVETLSPLSAASNGLTRKHAIMETPSPQSSQHKPLLMPVLPPQKLLETLSFSHFAELIEITDRLKRTFYEVEAVKGNWSVRELKRQIGTLYFERSGLLKNKKRLSRLVQSKAESNLPAQVIRDPYVFEFLGMRSKEIPSESHLEDALLDKLQDFLLELGKGFCFEARQRRIVIGGEYYFVDLVFYHRLLKCHILIELKADHFKHEHLGQLNTYVSWFKKYEMGHGDNPPLGILLCTEKNHALVEFALAGMNNKLFVSKYQLQLPKRREIQNFVERQLDHINVVPPNKRT